MTQGLETVPLKRVDYRGSTFEEMDVDAVIGRFNNLTTQQKQNVLNFLRSL